MRVLSVVGARPQFVKLAPVAAAFASTSHEHQVVHTGQHYDRGMSDVFFEELDVTAPTWNLGVGSGTHGEQTGQMLAKLDALFDRERPDWALVYGDTNSTIAAALAAAKLHVPVAHLEAGLRSFNRRMPEEHNRVLTDHAADLLLAPSQVAVDQLQREGLGDRTVLVGDVMTDVLLRVRDAVRNHHGLIPELAGLEDGGFLLATLHRASNTDDPDRLRGVIAALAGLPRPVVLTAHPRLVARAERFGVALRQGSLRPVAPLSYRAMVAALTRAAGVVTDSGGLQKEAFLLRVPCTTVRSETEWVETMEHGWNVLCDRPTDLAVAVGRAAPRPTDAAPYGDGKAADRVVVALAGAPAPHR